VLPAPVQSCRALVRTRGQLLTVESVAGPGSLTFKEPKVTPEVILILIVLLVLLKPKEITWQL
jgi:hypothetical protein